MRSLSIWEMLSALHSIIDTLNKFESSDVRNCYDIAQHNKDTSRLSDKQVEIIHSTFEKHFS